MEKYEIWKTGKNTLLKLYGLKKLAPQDELQTGSIFTTNFSKRWRIVACHE